MVVPAAFESAIRVDGHQDDMEKAGIRIRPLFARDMVCGFVPLFLLPQHEPNKLSAGVGQDLPAQQPWANRLH